MQELLPVNMLIVLGVAAAIMVFMTYYGFRLIFGVRASSFSRPRLSTVFGIWTFLFMGIFLGIYAMLAIYTGELGIGPELGWLFDNEYMFIFMCSLIVSFLIPLGYLYVYRGGS